VEPRFAARKHVGAQVAGVLRKAVDDFFDSVMVMADDATPAGIGWRCSGACRDSSCTPRICRVYGLTHGRSSCCSCVAALHDAAVPVTLGSASSCSFRRCCR